MSPQATSGDHDAHNSLSQKDNQTHARVHHGKEDHDRDAVATTRSPRAAINFLLTSEVHMTKKEGQGEEEEEDDEHDRTDDGQGEEEDASPALSNNSLVSENESPSLSTFSSSPEGERHNQTRRRSRTVMTPHQTRLLHKVLEETYFPTAAQRESLSRLLQVPQRTIQIWFQNQRQKAKHQQSQSSQHASRHPSTAHHGPNTIAAAAAAAAAAYSFQLQLRSLLSQWSPANATNFFATAKGLYNIQHLGQVTPRMLTTILTVLQSQAKASGEAFGESPSKRKAAELTEEDLSELRLAPLYRQQDDYSTDVVESYSPSFEPVAEGEELPSLKSLVSAAMSSPPLPVPCPMHSPPLSLKKMRSRDNLLDVLVEASDSSAF